MLRLSGTITSEGLGMDYLTVYDGTTADSSAILAAVGKWDGDTISEADAILSSSNGITLFFRSDYSNFRDGLTLSTFPEAVRERL